MIFFQLLYALLSYNFSVLWKFFFLFDEGLPLREKVLGK